MRKERLEDKMFDLLISDAVQRVTEKELEEMPAEEELTQKYASPSFDKRILRLVQAERRKASAKRLQRISLRAAAILLIALGIMVSAAFLVPSVRAALQDIFLFWQEKFVQMGFDNTEIDAQYHAGYLPVGYTVKEEGKGILIFTNEENGMIILEYTLGQSELYVDNEYSSITPTTINGQEAYVAKMDKDVNVIWKDQTNCLSLMSTDVGEEELIKIAQQITMAA